MSNIYEQKARKYKYKYLKLKQEYIGGGGEECKSIILNNIENTGINNFENIINENFKSSKYSKKFKDYINKEHIGELLNLNDCKEKNKNFKIFKNKGITLKYIAKLVYIGKVKDKKQLKTKINNKCINDINNDENIYLVISRNPGITFKEYFLSNANKSNDNFKTILINLNEGIEKFIKPLYKNNYVLGNCDVEHMLINQNKVYFDYSSIHYNKHNGEHTKILGTTNSEDTYTQTDLNDYILKNKIYDEYIIEYERFGHGANEYSINNSIPIHPKDATGIYNTKNSDIFGLCSFIPLFYTHFNKMLPVNFNNIKDSIKKKEMKGQGLELLNELVQLLNNELSNLNT